MSRRGKHGAYTRWWLCVSCGFGIRSLHWRRHRRRCARQTLCSACFTDFPCRKDFKEWTCPMFEKPQVLPDVADDEPCTAPREGVVRSLGMRVTRLEDGRWAIRAAWLDGPVIESTWQEAYWAAVRAK